MEGNYIEKHMLDSTEFSDFIKNAKKMNNQTTKSKIGIIF